MRTATRTAGPVPPGLYLFGREHEPRCLHRAPSANGSRCGSTSVSPGTDTRPRTPSGRRPGPGVPWPWRPRTPASEAQGQGGPLGPRVAPRSALDAETGGGSRPDGGERSERAGEAGRKAAGVSRLRSNPLLTPRAFALPTTRAAVASPGHPQRDQAASISLRRGSRANAPECVRVQAQQAGGRVSTGREVYSHNGGLPRGLAGPRVWCRRTLVSPRVQVAP